MVGKRRVVTSGDLLDCRGNFGKRVRLTRKTRPGALSFLYPDPGHPTPRRWKRLRPPLLRRRGGTRWASLATFFLALGLDDVCTGDVWNLPSEGTGVGSFPAGQSSRRNQCTGTGPFLIRCNVVGAHGQTRASYIPSAPSHQTHHSPHTITTTQAVSLTVLPFILCRL